MKKRKELLHLEYRNNRALKTYWQFYAGYKLRFFWVWVMFFIKALPQYVLPIIIAEVINMISEQGPADASFYRHLGEIIAIGFVTIVQNIPTHMYYVHLMSIPCRDVEKKLRSAICTRLQQLSIPYHTATKLGELQNKVTRDVENIENMTRMLLDSMPSIFFSVAVAISVTLIKAPMFVLFYLAAVPIAVTIFIVIRDRMAERNREFRRSVEEMSGRVTEMLRLIPITRAHHVEDIEINRVNDRLEKIRTAGLQVDYINSIFGSVNWVALMLFNLITLALIATLYRKGVLQIGIGDVGLLTGYFSTITGNVIGAMSCLPNITKGMESVRSIGEVLECPDLEFNAGKPTIDHVDGNFRFEHVAYTYPGSGAHAISDINLDVREGETIAFVGPSGAGKSTIAHLLIGFIRPSEGRILLDGCDMNSIDLRSYRNFISVVTQETLLFDGTIRENICYGISRNDFDVMDAVRNADLIPLVESLPEG
ncbi:MAG: ABC transporter ATP-binding protein, partial [Victivallaceae bacterium]|nr:ABC transporter ATP-binding protein [Victivallaceae bacterium]